MDYNEDYPIEFNFSWFLFSSFACPSQVKQEKTATIANRGDILPFASRTKEVF